MQYILGLDVITEEQYLSLKAQDLINESQEGETMYLAFRPELAQIQDLKNKLAASDYEAIKYAEGAISEEEYLPYKTQRAEWRRQINYLESLFNQDQVTEIE